MNTVELEKIKIVGNNKDKRKVIETLHLLGSIHIEQATQEGMKKDDPLDGIDEISLLLLKLNYIANEANIEKNYTVTKLARLDKLIEQAKSFLQKNLEAVQNNRKARGEIKENLDDKKSKYNELANLAINIQIEQSQKVSTLLYTSSKAVKSAALPDNTAIKHVVKEGKHYYKINALQKNTDEIRKELGRTHLKQINISYVEDNTKKTKKELLQEIKQCEKHISKINQELKQRIRSKESKLLYLITNLQNYREQHNISTNFCTSKNHFVLEGYVEKKDLHQLQEEVPNVTILSKKPKKAPTKLKNNGLNKNFEPITKLFSIPKYGYIDPTFLTTLFYPLFFGLMFSDVGYGLLMFFLIPVVNLYIGKEHRKNVLTVLIASAISTILFGLLFGSFFGDLIQIPALYKETFSATLEILILSLIIGFIHINIGITLNIYQAYKTRDFKKALYEVTPPLLIQIIAILLYFQQFTISIVLGTILLALLFKHKNIFGILDISDLFGTWFSYARLLALALATAGVALAVNVIAEEFLRLGVVGIILAIITLIIGHAFNFVINAIGCVIHSIRLHYVEFFSFFFEGGGRLFQPFKIQTRNNTA